MSELLLHEKHFAVLRAAIALCAGRRKLPLLDGWQQYIEEIPDIIRTMQAEINRMRSAPVAIPAGYKLMPIEPTPEIWKAAVTMDVWPLTLKSFTKLYAAMIEAAPLVGGEG